MEILLEFKQKPLVNGSKSLENGWNIGLGDNFNVDASSKTITLQILLNFMKIRRK